MASLLEFETYGIPVLPSTFEFGIIHNTQVFTSPLNGQTQTSEMPGARWRLRMGFEDLIESDIRTLIAFMVELRGMGNRFLMYDLSHPLPINTITGTGSISSAPSNNTVVLQGLTGDLSPGDYISINRPQSASDKELKMIIKKTTTNTYTIEPPLRTKPLSFYNGLNVDYTNPNGHFMLTSDTQTNWSSSGKVPLTGIDLEAVEVYAYG